MANRRNGGALGSRLVQVRDQERTFAKKMRQRLAKKKVTKKGPIVNPEKLHWTPLHIDIKRDKWSLKSKKPNNDE